MDRIITTEEFKQMTGADPINDDLERVNCKKAGQFGHEHCGIYACCNRPCFMGCTCGKQERA